jgi:hypothetical protein
MTSLKILAVAVWFLQGAFDDSWHSFFMQVTCQLGIIYKPFKMNNIKNTRPAERHQMATIFGLA